MFHPKWTKREPKIYNIKQVAYSYIMFRRLGIRYIAIILLQNEIFAYPFGRR